MKNTPKLITILVALSATAVAAADWPCHFYSHYTTNERSDGLVTMSMDGQVKWKRGRCGC